MRNLRNLFTALICATIIVGFTSCNPSENQKPEKGPAHFVSQYDGATWDSLLVGRIYSQETPDNIKKMEKYLKEKSKKSKMKKSEMVDIAVCYMPKRKIFSSPNGSSVVGKYYPAPKFLYILATKTLQKAVGLDSTARIIYNAARFRTPKEVMFGIQGMDSENSIYVINNVLDPLPDSLKQKIKEVVLAAPKKYQDETWLKYYKENITTVP